MADIRLEFILKLRNGETTNQIVSAPPEAADALVMKTLMQYATVGMLKRDRNKWILVNHDEISTVEVEIPTIAIANLGEIQQANTGKILL
jgi:hypothetical protein